MRGVPYWTDKGESNCIRALGAPRKALIFQDQDLVRKAVPCMGDAVNACHRSHIICFMNGFPTVAAMEVYQVWG
jgi:hypothetical protein